MGALEEVRDLAESVTRHRRLRLWDVEVGGRAGSSTVRVFVDSDEGVDLDTVAEVSEELSRGLDLRDPVPGRYTLEVSSPGLERNLRRPEHFALSTGRRACVKTRSPVVGSSHRLDGVILGSDTETVKLRLDTDDVVSVGFDEIKYARTVFEWS
jgi:ribosome maturation factor RimP